MEEPAAINISPTTAAAIVKETKAAVLHTDHLEQLIGEDVAYDTLLAVCRSLLDTVVTQNRVIQQLAETLA